jgi:hypothetical protein
MILILIVIIILLLAYTVINKNNNKSSDVIEGLNTFVGRMGIDDQYFHDKLFNDVFYYPNEPEGISGWDRCNSECPGRCVEFGPTSVAYCFSY